VGDLGRYSVAEDARRETMREREEKIRQDKACWAAMMVCLQSTSTFVCVSVISSFTRVATPTPYHTISRAAHICHVACKTLTRARVSL